MVTCLMLDAVGVLPEAEMPVEEEALEREARAGEVEVERAVDDGVCGRGGHDPPARQGRREGLRRRRAASRRSEEQDELMK